MWRESRIWGQVKKKKKKKCYPLQENIKTGNAQQKGNPNR